MVLPISHAIRARIAVFRFSYYTRREANVYGVSVLSVISVLSVETLSLKLLLKKLIEHVDNMHVPSF